MARTLKRKWSWPAAMGGLLLVATTAAAPPPPALGSTHQDACRASVVRVGNLPEPVVAGASTSTCLKQENPPIANPIAYTSPDNSVEISAAYARTKQPSNVRPGREAEAGAMEMTISHRGSPDPNLGYLYLDSATSEATADCASGVFSELSSSYVGRVDATLLSLGVLLPPGDSFNHSHFPLGAATLHFNERILSDTNANSVNDTVTRRAVWLETGDATRDVVVAESVATQYSGGC